MGIVFVLNLHLLSLYVKHNEHIFNGNCELMDIQD